MLGREEGRDDEAQRMRADPRIEAPDAAVAEHVDAFLDAQLSQHTRAGYSTDLALFFRWLRTIEKHPLEAQRPDLDRFRNYLSESVDADGNPSLAGRPRYAPTTVARRLSATRAFYAYLVDRGVLGASPAVGVKSPRVAKDPRGKALSVADTRRLLKAAEDVSADALAIVCLLGLNGLRVSEVCAADVVHLRSEDNGGFSLRVRGKGGKEAWVALNARTQDAVVACVAGRRTGPIVRRVGDRRRREVDPATPVRPWTQRSVWELLMALGSSAGLLNGKLGDAKSIHPHRLRHGFVTMLLDMGVPLPVVQDAARHSSAETTRIYDRSRTEYDDHPTHLLDL